VTSLRACLLTLILILISFRTEVGLPIETTFATASRKGAFYSARCTTLVLIPEEATRNTPRMFPKVDKDDARLQHGETAHSAHRDASMCHTIGHCSDRRRRGEPQNRSHTRCAAQGSPKHVRTQCASIVFSFQKVHPVPVHDACRCMTGTFRTTYRYNRFHTTPTRPRRQDRLRGGTLQAKGTRPGPNRNPAICDTGAASSVNPIF
jgi:hypothetical protein